MAVGLFGVQITSQAVPHPVLLLGTSHGIQQIPIQDMNRVSVSVVRGKVIGLVSGLTVDAVSSVRSGPVTSRFQLAPADGVRCISADQRRPGCEAAPVLGKADYVKPHR